MTITFLAGFICLFGEAETAGMQIVWTGCCLGVCAISAGVLNKLGVFNK